jgi:hypothetical protein
MLDSFGELTVEITRGQLEAWAGRKLTDEEVRRLDDAFPNSSVPEAFATMVDALNEDADA